VTGSGEMWGFGGILAMSSVSEKSDIGSESRRVALRGDISEAFGICEMS
jgi:hypothetical protein